MMKKLISILACLALLIVPFGSAFPFVSAASVNAPTVNVSIDPYASVHPNSTVTITYTAKNGTLSACDTRLEGTSISTDATVSFTPAAQGLSDGLHTLIMEATDSEGNRALESLTFRVTEDVEIDASASGASVTVFEADALDFTAGYGASADGSVDLSAVTPYAQNDCYQLQYTDDTTSVSSASGIPYQVFDIDLAGKTDGEVTVSYSGSTKEGERIALKAYNAKSGNWDVLGTFLGTGSVSEAIDIATYNDNGVIHVAAVLDYVANGADTMIWSTDPQHYTKFEDLHEYYYTIYRYAAEQYQNGDVGYILTTGDLVDDLPTASVSSKQWKVADKAMSYVEAVGMPNGVETGNHDVNTVTNTDYTDGVGNVNYSKYLETFPATRYNTERWYGGSLNNNTSHYDLVTIGNVDFIVLFLGYGVEATDETIAWANDALQTYRHRTAIVATHEYLDATQAVRAGRGQLIFDTIVDPNPNVKMVVCGHDDGSLCLEKTASDGRTVYEVLADYQFVEAEDPDFYANEHWIGKVEHCCGDGYIRLLTVEGDTLSSITYSPVTGRYNPYGNRENLTIDLDCGTPDRAFATARFSAAVLGNETSATDVDRVTKITDGTVTSYSAVTYASVPAAPDTTDNTPWPDTTYGTAATPSNPYYAHAAKEAPIVGTKVDLLETLGLGDHPTVASWKALGNQALNLSLNLEKTPYLYYSFAQPTGSNFTFALLNNTTTAPWLTFADATLGGSVFNSTAENWDSYADTHSQYFTTSATGCIDLRTMSVDGVSWIVNQLTLYNQKGYDVVISYMFFGSDPITASMPDTTYGDPATPTEPFAAHAANTVPTVKNKVNLLDALGMSDNTAISGYTPYDGQMGLTIDINKTPYLYYSFALPEGANFTFGLYNNQSSAPWFTFLDANKGGTTLNSTVGNWNAYTDASQYFTTSATGCIDMRKVMTDPDVATWIVNQITLYNNAGKEYIVQYLFFGSAALDTDAIAGDVEALSALYTKAYAIDTSAYTTASAAALDAAIKIARIVDKTDSAAVADAYAGLKAAVAGLQTPKAAADTTGLVSVKNYSLSNSNWVCNSTGAALTSSSSYLNVTQTDDGMILSHSDAATHSWPHARYTGSGYSYSVEPYGGMYLKLDVDAECCWAVNLFITQGDNENIVVRVNSAVENAFNDHTNDGREGVFQGVYNISDAFSDAGIDPTSPFTVNKTCLFVIGGGEGTVTYNHLELFTEEASAADRSALQAAIYVANSHTKSMYTSASWSAMQTALSEANTANSDSSYTQPDINYALFKLNNAIDALELTTDIEPDGSLLPDDLGLWQNSDSSVLSISRNSDGATVFANSNSPWPYASHSLRPSRYITVADHQLEIDMTVNGSVNILLLADNEWVSITKYVNTNRAVGNDLIAGTYIAAIRLSDIEEFADKVAVNLQAVRVFTVAGSAASSDVTIRRLAIDDYTDYKWDLSQTYGPAATPSNPYYAHCAKNEPIVAEKVDVLAAIGLDHPTVNSLTSYGDSRLHLTIDLEKTPYLYFSFQQPANSNFTFGLFNDNSSGVPYFTFFDAALGGASMNTSVDTWDSYGSTGDQYAASSVTGCVDMRTLLSDSSVTTWLLNQVSFYNQKGQDVTVSYLFFGSEALSDGYTDDPTVDGDVNLDGVLTSADARLCISSLIGTAAPLSAYQQTLGDMNADTKLSSSDVRRMLQTIVNA